MYVCDITNKEINDDPIKNKNNNNNDLCNPSKKKNRFGHCYTILNYETATE